MTGVASTAVALESVAVQFGEMPAVDGIELVVHPGETVAIVGPSGAGKTTLLKVVAGILRPSSGRAWLDGRDTRDLRPGRELTALVGMMQQRLDLVSQLSVRHNVEAGHLGRWSLGRALAALFLPLRDKASAAAIERVGLTGMGDQRVSRLSGGEQQRVALARLLVQDPEVILADEPVASLDPALAGEVLELFISVARERGKTVIASLHTPEMARRHFGRVIGLRDGKIEFDVAADDLTDGMLKCLYSDGRREPMAAAADTGVSALR